MSQNLYIGETNNLRHRINLHKCSQHESNKFYVMPFFKMKNDKNLRKLMKVNFINKFKPELNCDIAP